MRYIGNKTRLLGEIDKLIEEKEINNGTFADLFSGTGSVADHFKDRFRIIGNDMMFYSEIFTYAKVNNESIPIFKTFAKKFKKDPFEFWNEYNFSNENKGFVTNNFSSVGNRNYFTKENALKIDTIRNQLDLFLKQNILNVNEYNFLLASLLDSVMSFSNISGTYEAFLKEYDPRALKDFKIKPIDIENKKLYSKNNKVYNMNANDLVENISGNVAYIDTPYTVTQYASAYHVLETIAKNDSPELVGKTGRRVNRKMSDYSKKTKAKSAFEDLLSKLNFDNIIISYSNQSLIPFDELIDLINNFAIKNTVDIKTINYREYKNLNSSKKRNGETLKEYLIYFKKA